MIRVPGTAGGDEPEQQPQDPSKAAAPPAAANPFAARMLAELPAPVEAQEPARAAPPANPYADRMLREIDDPAAVQQREERFLASYRMALHSDPALFAEANGIAKTLGVQPEFVTKNIDVARRLVQERALRERDLRRTSPQLAEALGNFTFARIARDDIDNLSTTESTFGRLALHFEAGEATNERGWLGIRKALGMGSPADAERLIQLQALSGDSSADSGFTAAASRILGQMSGTVPAALGVGVGTSAVATPFAGAVAGAATTFSLSGAIASGNAYLDMIDRGIPPEIALPSAFGRGVLEGGLETLSTLVQAAPFAKAVRGAGKAAAGLTRATGGRAFQTFIKDYVAGLGTEIATELVQEAVGAGIEDAAAAASPNARPGTPIAERMAATLEETAKGMSLLGIPGPALRFAADSVRASQAAKEVQFFQQLHKTAAASQTRQNSPETFGAFAGELGRQAGADTVYVEGTKLVEGLRQAEITPEELRRTVPELAQQIAAAVSFGGDVVLPMETYAAKVAGTPLGKALLPFVRLDPDSMAAGDADGFRQGEREEVGRIVGDVKQREESERAFRESGQAVYESHLGQLRATQRLSERESRGAAQMHRAFVETRARQAGMLPGEFAAKFPLFVRAATSGVAGDGLNAPRGDFHPVRGIRLFEAADVSTALHEGGHYFLHTSIELAALPNAPEVVRQDVQTFLLSNGIESVDRWRGMSLDEQRKAHERFARGFEEYVATGQAPSAELQGLFGRFAAWLRRLYRNVRGALNAQHQKELGEDLPPLSPELRGFFDRMLASEDAIARTEETRQLLPLFDVKPANMTDAEWDAYRQMADDARGSAADELNAAGTRQALWLSGAQSRIRGVLQREAAGVREQVRQEVAPEVERQPVYRARRYVLKGELLDVEGGAATQVGGTTKLDTDAVRAILPGVDLRKVGLTVKGGLNPDTVAPVFGFPSGEAMVKALATAPPLEVAIDGATDARMLAEYSELTSPESIDEAVAAALQSEARARFVAVEERILTQATAPVRLAMRAARMAAQQIVAGSTIRSLRPRVHTVAEARAGREARSALRRGDGAAAATAKRQQTVQIQLARESRAAIEEVRRAQRRFRDFFRDDKDLAKTRNVDLIHAARAILAHYGVGEHDRTPAAYVEQLRAYNPSLLAQLSPLIDQATASARELRDLTVDEFRILRDSVEALWHQAGRELQMRVEGERVELADVATRLANRLREIGLTDKPPGSEAAVGSRDEWVRDGMSALATTTRVEHWAGALGNDWTRYLWRPVREALTAYRTSRNAEVEAYEQLLQKHRDGGHMTPGQIEASELGYTFAGKAELLGAMLHTGNDSNRMKLLLGRQWGERRDDGSVNSGRWERFVGRMLREGKLTEADYDWMQSVWDLLEKQKPLLQATHRELFGFYFQEVEPSPFGLFGKQYRGGYVPATADKFVTQSARLQDQLAELEGDFRNTVPSVPRGFTKSRDESARPLSLDVRRLAGHLDDVLRFAHVQPAVRDVLRLLNHKELQPTLARFNPTAHEKLLLPWLHRAARGTTTEPGRNQRVDRFWHTLRVNAGLAAMVGNVSNAVQNVTGLFVAMVKVGPRHVMPTIFRAMGSGKAMAAEMAQASPFMADRSTKTIFDSLDGIRKFVEEPSLLGKAQEFSRKHGYILQKWTQSFVDLVTWHASRSQALEQLGATADPERAHTEAVARADAAVRTTQGSAEAEDVSSYEVGSPFWRALTQFQGWFNNLANLNVYEAQRIVRDLGWRQGAPQLFGLYVYGMALPMIAAGAIAKTFAGTWGDEDEDGLTDEFADWFFGSQLKGVLAGVPVFGQFGTLAWNVLGDGESWNDRMPLPAALSLMEQSFKSVRNLGDGASGREVRDVGTLLTMLFGVPVSVVARPAGYAVDVAGGDVQPSGPADLVRGLITGRAAEGTRK